jgi:hypothetical protein
VKKEINRLLDAKFFRPCQYTYWISNIVSVERKGTKKLRLCIDFRDLNKATPKYEYLRTMCGLRTGGWLLPGVMSE